MTRAKPRSPVSGSRRPTAIDRLSVEMYGNGMARVDRERREDREDLVEEALAERLVVLGDGRVVDELDALGRERPADVDEDRRVVGDEVEDALAGGRQLLVGGAPVGRAGDLAGLDLLAQAGDADLEELVEVAGEDGQELDPLEQRVALVARLVEDAGVELEPRQLAVEVRERSPWRAARGAARGDDGTCGSSGCAWIDRGHRLVSGLSRSGSPTRSGPAGEDSTRRPVSSSAHVPPLAARRIEPDAHPLARTSGRRTPRRVRRNRGSSGGPGRLAAGRAGRGAGHGRAASER